MNLNDIVERYPIDVMEHAERVMDLVRPFGKEYMMVALLHDIIEDTNTTIEELALVESLDVKFTIIDDISTLTRKPNQTYFEYIDYIVTKGNKRAKIIKYYDILDHLHNKATLKPSLEKRYLKAKELLEEAI